MRLPWGLRWWELVPEAVLGAVLTAFLATETAAATSAFGSRKALTLMAGAALAWAVGRIVLVRFTPWPALRLAVFGAAAVAVAAVVVLPAYDDTTVVETLVASPATTTATTTPAPAVAATGPEPAAPAAAPATPAQPVALRSAAIGGIDHRASGTAVLYRQPDGTYVVGLEGIDIQPGPDYDLYVVPGAARDGAGGGGVDGAGVV
ncbi:MAG TPA: hypothetical protein VM263_03510 [Acidimicrobiales bacterium]|nr:hypothetical protein [Acidimicrobiales bacterium]